MWSPLLFVSLLLPFAASQISIPPLFNAALPLSPPVSIPPILNLPISIAPITSLSIPKAKLIPGRYIVKVKGLEHILPILRILTRNPNYIYSFGGFTGFAADMSDQAVGLIRLMSGVESIEQDSIISTSEIFVHNTKRAYVTQNPSTWGLGRISHKIISTSPKYVYDSTAGSGTCAYVIDTGILTTHPEFEGRASFLANFAGDGINSDVNGHGTHCAGTIASKTYGVAKKARIFGIKVLGAGGQGSSSGVIAGINFAINDLKGGRSSSCPNGAVISMSLGGPKSVTVNAAAASAISQGLFIAAAAGNEAVDANNTSPASEPTVFTVAAVDVANKFATAFSNFGSAVDILAPGVAITSTWLKNGFSSLSGTSMATPHVAGLALYLLGLEGKKTPAQLRDRITALSLKNFITLIRGTTVNALAFNGNPSG